MRWFNFAHTLDVQPVNQATQGAVSAEVPRCVALYAIQLSTTSRTWHKLGNLCEISCEACIPVYGVDA